MVKLSTVLHLFGQHDWQYPLLEGHCYRTGCGDRRRGGSVRVCRLCPAKEYLTGVYDVHWARFCDTMSVSEVIEHGKKHL